MNFGSIEQRTQYEGFPLAPLTPTQGGQRVLGWCKLGLEATEHPTVMDIAWAAGVYDGEGCSFKDPRKGGSTLVVVGQKDRWLLDRFRALFGGSVGPTIHKYAEITWQWRASGARAKGFLMTVHKFLSPRRKVQVRHALGLE